MKDIFTLNIEIIFYKVLLFLFLGLFLIPFDAAASETNIKQECISFYDERKAISEKEHEKREEIEPEIKRLMQEGKEKDAWKLSLTSMQPLFEISDKAAKCGPYDERYYKVQADLCLAFTYGSEHLNQEGRVYLFEKMAKPFFCDPAMARGDEIALLHTLRYHLNRDEGQEDYEGALRYLNDFIDMHPGSADLILFAPTILLRDKNGVNQNAEKAFKIVRDLTEKHSKKQLPCELSLYYRNGIGTPVNEEKAEEWLAVYKKNSPGENCEFLDFGFLFGDDSPEKGILKEESEE